MTGELPPSVAILISDFDGEGGMQQQTRRLAAGLSAAGSRVCVVARNYYGLPRQEKRGEILVRRTPVAAPPDPRSVAGAPPVASRAALTSILFLVSGFAWGFARRRDYDLIQCQQMFGSMLLGMALRAATGKPVVVRVTLSGERGEAAQIRRMPFSSLRRRIMRRVDHWVALTSEMAGELTALGIEADRISVVPNAAPIPEGSAVDDRTRGEARGVIGFGSAPMIVFAGRLSAEKGVETLLRAMPGILARHPDAILFILGGGGPFSSEEAALRRQADSLGIREAVRFEGFVDDVTPYLLASDVFVLPSTSEGMSNALVEAMCAGVPIVTTDIGAHREVITGDEHALLVPPRNADALAEAVSRLLANRDLRIRLGRAARARAETHHSTAAMVAAYLNAYRETGARTGRSPGARS